MTERKPRVLCGGTEGGVEVSNMRGDRLVKMPAVDISIEFDLGDHVAAREMLDHVVADVTRQITEASTT